MASYNWFIVVNGDRRRGSGDQVNRVCDTSRSFLINSVASAVTALVG